MTSTEDTSINIKVVLLGDQAVGKTSLACNFIRGEFDDTRYNSTISLQFSTKTVEINGKNVDLGIWDTAGLERYHAMTRIYYRGARAAIVCYDVTDPRTFDKAKEWISELRDVEENCSIYLCGTKRDLIQNTDQMNPNLSDVQNYANSIQSELFITSSITGENVANIFNAIAKDYLLNPTNTVDIEDLITLKNNDTNSNWSCWCWG